MTFFSITLFSTDKNPVDCAKKSPPTISLTYLYHYYWLLYSNWQDTLRNAPISYWKYPSHKFQWSIVSEFLSTLRDKRVVWGGMWWIDGCCGLVVKPMC